MEIQQTETKLDFEEYKEYSKEYEEALILYLGTLQGGSRDRIIPELKEVISKWNTQYEEAERKIEEKLTKKVENEIDKDSKTSNDAENKEQKKKKRMQLTWSMHSGVGLSYLN